MRFTFRFTNDEYQEFRQLNRTIATPRWKSYLLALLCLVPSFCLILGTNSLIAILATVTIFVSVLGLAVIAAIGDKPIVDKHDHVFDIDQKTAKESQSHSYWETRWDYYDSFDESDRFYLLGRLDRFTAIPKRVLQNAQLDEFRLLTQQIGADDSDSEPERQPVPVFAELFPPENELRVYQFAYQTDDLASAMSERLQVVDFARQHDSPPESNAAKPKARQRLLGTFWMLVFCFMVIYIISSVPSSENWKFSQLVFLALAIVLPFLLMKWLNRWFRSRQKRKSVRVPTESISMQLMPNGWAIGNIRSCQFFDWRDVESFYENKFCFGFHTFNDLVQIVPKRIFADQDEADQFLDQAINLRREHRRSFAQTAVAIETGNPYQAPIS